MAKEKNILFVCNECGEEFAKWQGKCPNCGAWNSLKEYNIPSAGRNIRSKNKHVADFSEPIKLADVEIKNFARITSGTGEFDRVLGGGIVPGSVVLLGGDPGIGKSTLLLEISTRLKNVLYVSGEESNQQIKMRFDRLKLKSDDLKIYAETDLSAIIQTMEKEKPAIVVIDSIQTIYSSDFPSTPGSIVQVRECALRLQQFAKSTHTVVFLVGHVTKEGTVAGPRTLEHLVDVVLYLEGERMQEIRILRSVKNRFGATDEIGVFEMTEKGLVPVDNPSKMLLAERAPEASGSVVTALIEGSRALLVEVQALAATTTFGFPQRRAAGMDLNRLQLLVAVLQKRANLNLANQDIFVNIVGGVKTHDPAVDLAVAVAIASAVKNKPLDNNLCVFGELGLTGEIRHVVQESKRISEAKRIGFDKFIESKNIKDIISNLFTN